jgi:hypothetical protein
MDDHDRLDRLLAAALEAPYFDRDAFEAFRAGLLRHIGIEEKLLFPALRLRGLAIDATLRREHSAIAALLVPTPDRALAAELHALVARHNAREEGAGGLYDAAEALLGADADDVLTRARAAAEPPLARHFDGPGTHRTADGALRAAERTR